MGIKRLNGRRADASDEQPQCRIGKGHSTVEGQEATAELGSYQSASSARLSVPRLKTSASESDYCCLNDPNGRKADPPICTPFYAIGLCGADGASPIGEMLEHS